MGGALTEVRRSTLGEADDLGSRHSESEVIRMVLVAHWLCTSALKHSGLMWTLFLLCLISRCLSFFFKNYYLFIYFTFIFIYLFLIEV